MVRLSSLRWQRRWLMRDFINRIMNILGLRLDCVSIQIASTAVTSVDWTWSKCYEYWSKCQFTKLCGQTRGPEARCWLRLQGKSNLIKIPGHEANNILESPVSPAHIAYVVRILASVIDRSAAFCCSLRCSPVFSSKAAVTILNLISIRASFPCRHFRLFITHSTSMCRLLLSRDWGCAHKEGGDQKEKLQIWTFRLACSPADETRDDDLLAGVTRTDANWDLHEPSHQPDPGRAT